MAEHWVEHFKREVNIKNSVILYGNVLDITKNTYNSGKYQSVLDNVNSILNDMNYDSIVIWDAVDGINHEISKDISSAGNSDENKTAANNMEKLLGKDFAQQTNQVQAKQSYKDPKEFFSYALKILKNNAGKKTAIVIDYSDYIYGNSQSLTQDERANLLKMAKALQSQSYDINGSFFEGSNTVILIAKNQSLFPSVYYLNNPLVSSVHVPLPDLPERLDFINQLIQIGALRVEQSLNDEITKNKFAAALDGFTLKEILQLCKLSRQNETGTLKYEKLINLFKYGEKRSPWEDLSRERLETLKDELLARVKGQNEAVEKVRSVIIRAFTGFSGLQHSADQKKPKGSLFFVGPTGVGKTELAKSIAKFLFDDENACIRFDMSEFSQEHSDQRLIGAPPGYVGYEAGGQLTNAVKARPFCVLLFDEIEKAHGRILDKFLQILEDGRLTDSKGETVYFSETFIIFTSNIGAAEIEANQDEKIIKSQFIQSVKNHFVNELKRPELLNRIGDDNIVAFNFIKNPQVFTAIANAKIKPVFDLVKDRYKAVLEIENQEEAFIALAKEADITKGGRGFLNLIESKIINPLSDFIFETQDSLTGRKVVVKKLPVPGSVVFTFDIE